MGSMPTTATRPVPLLRRGRGRVAVHDPETLLALASKVARTAARDGKAATAASAPMGVFNVVKLDVDRARGIADPKFSPERTPTAEAIQLCFKQLAERPVSWPELLSGALRPPRDRIMWLAALRREDPRDGLSDELVAHALGLVAAHHGALTLTLREYTHSRDALVAEDRALHRAQGVLERVLPTGNQILAYTGFKWENALKLAGMTSAARQHERHRKPPPQQPGMPVAELAAIYAALNGMWPSAVTLRHFADSCNARVAASSGPMGPYREHAAALLRVAGIAPPTRTRGGGKAKRMTYRYPSGGIPGAPPRNPRRNCAEGTERPTMTRRRHLHGEERRALAVLSLRVWLAALPADARRVRSEYVVWQVGTQWTRAGAFDEGLGGFSALKREAAKENARVRQAGGDTLADALGSARSIRTEHRVLAPPRTVAKPEPVLFAEALRAVLSGPTTEALAPKQ